MVMFVEKGFAAFCAQMARFCVRIVPHQGTLGLNADKVLNLSKASELANFVLVQNDAAEQYSLSYTAYKNLLFYGADKQVLGQLPPVPAYPAKLPALVLANVQGQFIDLIKDCFRSSFFTETIGLDLGIITQKAVFAPENGRPNLTGKTAQGGHPLLHANIGQYEGFEIWKDNGDAQGYKLCATLLHPNFIDNSALPAHGVNVTWKYKAIYLYQGKQAGTWSSEVLITVYGSV